jgi:hypothetical protein
MYQPKVVDHSFDFPAKVPGQPTAEKRTTSHAKVAAAPYGDTCTPDPVAEIDVDAVWQYLAQDLLRRHITQDLKS